MSNQPWRSNSELAQKKLKELWHFVRNDKLASAHQTLGQYRDTIIKILNGDIQDDDITCLVILKQQNKALREQAEAMSKELVRLNNILKKHLP